MPQAQEMKNISTPHDHDVLSGRGNFVNYHPGNEHFRALVRKHKHAYVACPKPMKSKYSRMIVESIRTRDPPGRFLKQDADTKLWYDIGDKKALDKTRQALREGAPDIMKDIKTDGEEGSGGENPANSPQSQEGRHVISSGDLGPSAPVLQATGGANNNRCLTGFDQFGNAPQQSLVGMAHGSIDTLNQNMPAIIQQSRQQQQAIMQPRQLIQQPQRQNRINGMLSSAQALAGQRITPQQVLSQPLPMHQQQQQQQQQQHQQQNQQQPHGLVNAHQGGYGGQQQQLQQPQVMPVQQMNVRRSSDSAVNVQNGRMPLNTANPSYVSLDHIAMDQYRSLEPRPLPSHTPQQAYVANPNGNALHQPQHQMREIFDGQYEERTEALAPLSPKAMTHRRPGLLERSGSDRSLKFDNIFHEGAQLKIEQTAEPPSASSGNKSKNYASSIHLSSVMSLSMGEINLAPGDDNTPSTDQLSSMLDSSLQISGGKKKVGVEGSRVTHNSDLAHVFDMSVATLGDRLSEFGDLSNTRMTESQANMSFGNVFEETDVDVNATR